MSTEQPNLDEPFQLEFERPLAALQAQIKDLLVNAQKSGRDFSAEIADLRKNLAALLKKTYANLSAWETVLVARHERRPRFEDVIDLLPRIDFCELHGDRSFGDDRAIVCGMARIAGQKVMLIGHSKGRTTTERLERNFGCAHPEGYRKALLKMKLAAKFGLPIVTLIDTPGAYPGVGAEERGQSQAIALNLLEMSRLPVPIISVVIGEGGSGGALGIGVCDRLAMFEYSYYSVISPEGCASILFKDPALRQQAADSLHLTARQLKQLGLVDKIIREPLGGAHRDRQKAVQLLEDAVKTALLDLRRLSPDKLVAKRYQRYRAQGNAYVLGA